MQLNYCNFDYSTSDPIDAVEESNSMDICHAYSVQNLWQKTQGFRTQIGRSLLNFFIEPKAPIVAVYYDLASLNGFGNYYSYLSYRSEDRNHFAALHFDSEEAMRLWLEKRNNR
ncbi:MAG: hypothetical protein AAGE59_27810 [Cyanobacteria bacterium P01_F01_bin.86]